FRVPRAAAVRLRPPVTRRITSLIITSMEREREGAAGIARFRLIMGIRRRAIKALEGRKVKEPRRRIPLRLQPPTTSQVAITPTVRKLPVHPRPLLSLLD